MLIRFTTVSQVALLRVGDIRSLADCILAFKLVIVTPPCKGVKWKETKQKANLFSNIKNPNSAIVIHSSCHVIQEAKTGVIQTSQHHIDRSKHKDTITACMQTTSLHIQFTNQKASIVL
jgi:ABC-type uncharacterized transport system ATPase subunit